MAAQIIGTPSIKDYKAIIQENLTKNCPITIEDINVAERIFRKDISSIKRKTTRCTPKPMVIDIIKVPKELIENNQEIVFALTFYMFRGYLFIYNQHGCSFQNHSVYDKHKG